MARPIHPTGLRRLTHGGKLEARGKGGNWIDYGMLGHAAKTAVWQVIVKGRNIPDEAFLWESDDADSSDAPQGMPQDAPVDAPVPQDAPAQPTAQDGPSQGTTGASQGDAGASQGMPQADGLMGSLADFVRGIARDEDDKIITELFGFVDEQVRELSERLPAGGNGGVTRIEVKLPCKTVTSEGLFHKCFPDMLHLASIGQHIFLPGPPGTGKTHVFDQVADALGYQRSNISCYNQMPESRIWGARDINANHHETDMLKGLRHAAENPDSGFMFLFDEMDSGSPNLYTSMNTAMSNGFIKAPNGDRIPIGSNVVFVAAANTFGTGPTAQFAGKNAIDPATLDRFEYIPWDIDETLEEALVRQYLHDDQIATEWLDAWRTTRKNVTAHGLKVFVTPRGAIKGAKIIASGMDMHKAYGFVFGNKIPADQLAKVTPF